MGLVSGFLGAAGAMSAANYNSNVAMQNADLSDKAAADAIARGTQAAQRAELQGNEVAGQQVAGYGASGVTMQGSPSQVLADTKFFSDINVQTAMNNAYREAWGYQVKGNQFRDQAAMIQQTGKMQALGSFLGGVTSTAGQLASGGFLSPAGSPE